MTRAALSGDSQCNTDECRARAAHLDRVRCRRGYSASWDDAQQAVRFAISGGILHAAISRDALEMLAGARLPNASEALREFRRHRTWIETLAAVMMEERCELAVVLTQDDVCLQLAYEAEMLSQALRG